MCAILYRSPASRAIETADLEAIHRSAENRNRLWNISGILLFGPSPATGSGGFVHWLEGGREAVDALYMDLKADERHGGLSVLAAGDDLVVANSGERLFPGQSLMIVHVSALPQSLDGFLEALSQARPLQ